MNPSMIRNNDIKRKTECITKCVMKRCHRGCGGFEGMVGGGGFLGGPCEGRTGGRPGMGGEHTSLCYRGFCEIELEAVAYQRKKN